MRFFSLFLLVLLLFSTLSSFAHEEEQDNLEEQIRRTNLLYLGVAALISAAFVIVAMGAAKRPHFTGNKKKILFLGIIIPIIIFTLYFAGSTIYLNVISTTKGPVHWHADFEVYACNEKLDLFDPEGMLNRVGTSVFHEHGDNRIHLEGVVVDIKDVSLHEFFEVTGGELTKESMTFLTQNGPLTFTNGDKCNGVSGKLQVFVYKTDDNIVTQEKIDDFPEYVLSPESIIPPGDCLIIEFGEEKASTNSICETYRIALEKGDVKYGS